MIVTKKFRAKGMQCHSCEQIIQKTAKKIDGVKELKMSYETEKGEVTFDDTKTNINEIFKAIEDKGYDCSLTKEQPKEVKESKEEIKEDIGHKEHKTAHETHHEEQTTHKKHEQDQKTDMTKTNNAGIENLIKISTVIISLLLIFVSYQLFTMNKNLEALNSKLDSLDSTGSDQNQPSQPSAIPKDSTEPSLNAALLMDDDAVKGDKNAPVTIIEWSDFECPFCERFYSQSFKKIDEQYIKTGKVKFVYRDYPLGFHPNAQKAAEAAECAGEQGKFYEMHDLLFEKGVSGGIASFKQYAADLKLDTNKFNDCLDSGKMAQEVSKDTQDGNAVGVSGTPGFVINGQSVSGAQPFEVFKQIIDGELAKQG